MKKHTAHGILALTLSHVMLANMSLMAILSASPVSARDIQSASTPAQAASEEALEARWERQEALVMSGNLQPLEQEQLDQQLWNIVEVEGDLLLDAGNMDAVLSELLGPSEAAARPELGPNHHAFAIARQEGPVLLHIRGDLVLGAGLELSSRHDLFIEAENVELQPGSSISVDGNLYIECDALGGGGVLDASGDDGASDMRTEQTASSTASSTASATASYNASGANGANGYGGFMSTPGQNGQPGEDAICGDFDDECGFGA